MDTSVIIILLLLMGAMAAYVPVYMCLFFTGILGFVFFAPDTQTLMLVQSFFKSMDNFALVVVLFFILCGNIMTAGTIVEKLIKMVNTLVSWLPGGLGMAGCLGCGLFGAISGSTVATVVALGGFMIPALIKNGYSEKYSVGLMTTAPNLGIIIPPSISMILYAMITNVSLQGLFLTGFIPGIFIMGFTCIYTYFLFKDSQTIVRMPVPSFGEVVTVFKEGFWSLMLPVIIFVGTFSGVFTANEAAVVACMYAFFVELVIHKSMKFRDVKKVIVGSAVTSATLLIIVAGATCFGRYLTFENVPGKIAEAVIAHIHSGWTFLMVINAVPAGRGHVHGRDLRHPDHRAGDHPAAAHLRHRLHAFRAAHDGEPGDRLLHAARGGQHVHHRRHGQQGHHLRYQSRNAFPGHSTHRSFHDDLYAGCGPVAAQGHGLLGAHGRRHSRPVTPPEADDLVLPGRGRSGFRAPPAAAAHRIETARRCCADACLTEAVS